MKSKILIWTFALALISNAAVAEIYKWTDKNGQVHYSEKKPVNEPESETSGIQVITGQDMADQGSKIKYTTRRNHYYCGEENIHQISSERILLRYANENINRYKKSLAKKKELLKEHLNEKNM